MSTGMFFQLKSQNLIIFVLICFNQVSEKLLEGKELEFFSWEGESEELLRGVREKLNMLGEVNA